MQTPLTEMELYAIARAIGGQPWQMLTVSPLVGTLLTNLNVGAIGNLLRMLGTEITEQILKIDPYTLPPTPQPTASPLKDVYVPPLPADAQLSDRALRAAEGVAGWLDDALAWAIQRSPMTPAMFLEAGLLWIGGLAIARRCAASLHKLIYPHLYVLWVAPTSIFKKTTGMEAINDLAQAAMPHMLLPEESTPESFVAALGGKHSSNYESLSPYEKKLEDLGCVFAAQRGLILDEASSLFGAARKDYMQGQAEMIMRLYDAPPRYTRTQRGEGKIVIYNGSLCILGATTPVSMNRNISSASWETGELARFVLLYPEHELPYGQGTILQDFAPPSALVTRLAKLHKALPKPPDASQLAADKLPEAQVLRCHMDTDAYAAYALYTKAVTFDLLKEPHKPDPRIQPNYTRLPVQAVKVAVILAAFDWADDSKRPEVPHITLGHWARAQQIAESWRAATHRMLNALNRSDDSIADSRVLDHLLVYSEGETLRELTLRTGLRRKAIEEALKSLIDSGLVVAERIRRGERGPEATTFRAV